MCTASGEGIEGDYSQSSARFCEQKSRQSVRPRARPGRVENESSGARLPAEVVVDKVRHHDQLHDLHANHPVTHVRPQLRKEKDPKRERESEREKNNIQTTSASPHAERETARCPPRNTRTYVTPA